jgi:hypothetical protein
MEAPRAIKIALTDPEVIKDAIRRAKEGEPVDLTREAVVPLLEDMLTLQKHMLQVLGNMNNALAELVVLSTQEVARNQMPVVDMNKLRG